MRSGVWSAISSRDVEALAQRVDHFANQQLGRGGAGGDADRCGVPEPVPVDVRGALDQPGRNAHSLGDFGEPQRIAAVGSADDQHSLALGGDRLDRRLAVGRRVANVLAARRPDLREPRLEARRRPPRCRRPTASSGSGRRGSPGSATSTDWASSTVSIKVIDPAGHLAEGADDLGMAGMADEQDVASVLDQPLGLAVDLGDQRAGRVDEGQAAVLRGGRHRLGHAVGREDHRPVVRDFVQLVDENRAQFAAAARRRSGCGRSRGGRRPALRTARARARRSGSRGRLRRRIRAGRRSGRAEGLGVRLEVQALRRHVSASLAAFEGASYELLPLAQAAKEPESQ